MPALDITFVPRRLFSQSLPIAPAIMAMTRGSSRSPVDCASLPCTTCRNGEMRNITPVIPKPTTMKATVAHENRALRKRFRSTSGNFTRSSHATKAAISSAPPTSGTYTCALPQPRTGSSMMAYTTAVTPTTSRTAPSQSRRRGFGSLLSGTKNHVPMSARTTTGPLIRKMDPHS